MSTVLYVYVFVVYCTSSVLYKNAITNPIAYLKSVALLRVPLYDLK